MGCLSFSILRSSSSDSGFRPWLRVASPYPSFQSGAQVESLAVCGGDGAPHLRPISRDRAPPRP
ncbi:hypothetical protein ACQJBY_000664 [Aegilops geniculata]